MAETFDDEPRTIRVGGRNTTYDPEARLWLRVRDRLSREGYDAHAVMAAVQRAIKAEGWTLRPPPETPALPDPDMANYHPEIGCCGKDREMSDAPERICLVDDGGDWSLYGFDPSLDGVEYVRADRLRALIRAWHAYLDGDCELDYATLRMMAQALRAAGEKA